MENQKQLDQTPVPAKILVIAAHHDDIEFGVAGSVALWVDNGARVSYCIVTDGSAGSNDPDTNLEELVTRRKEEQLAAARVVGVEDVHFLGYRDGTLQPTLELRRDLTRIIRELRPDRVVCQDPTTMLVGDRYINHPDHRAAAEAAVYAVFPSAETRPIFPELLDEGLEPHHVNEVYLMLTLQADTVVDITSTIDRKLEALACHASQVGQESLDRIREWNADNGKELGCDYAEVYRVMRFGGATSEPVENEGQGEASLS
ncbi:MAG: PIG-L family deacetylase [Chloroflexaceae bacterium]|nr:PIG-L family deacetylase [Chloroflexaceae bacterium]